jgi:group I intron endonuclease
MGSAKDLYLRLNEHLSNRKSTRALQTSISKYGLENFNTCIYEYFTYENKTNSFKLLTYLETMYINKFKLSNLYNFFKNASSSEGYKHTDAAKQKMVERFEDITNHPL